jgi:hypothetical protein
MYTPLQIIRARILVFAIRAKRTYIPRRLMNEAVANHLVLALETFATFGAETAYDRAIVWSVLRVYIGVRTVILISACFQNTVYKL